MLKELETKDELGTKNFEAPETPMLAAPADEAGKGASDTANLEEYVGMIKQVLLS